MSIVVWREQWLDYCSQMGRNDVNVTALLTLADLCLLPTYERDGRMAALARDLEAVAFPIERKHQAINLFDKLWGSIDETFLVKPDAVTSIEVPRPDDARLPPEFFAAAKNFLSRGNLRRLNNLIYPQKRSYFSAATVSSSSADLLEYASAQVDRAWKIRSDQSTFFANSAYYMGSKKVLGPFLVESLKGVLNECDVILDLMCGSGAASKALSFGWKTIASDALEFCTILARALGSGYSVGRATRTLDVITGHVRTNIEALSRLVQPLIEKEDEFAHSELTGKLIREYIHFVEETPRYPEGGGICDWRPYEAVMDRQKEPGREPYCLVTAYFANVYFGVRQSVEIDSIRFAINMLGSDVDRAFALAALMAACSQLGTGYAGQFAQPLRLTSEKVPKVIESRAHSIFHEFSVRFAALAGESERAPHEIKTITGSWQKVLNKVANWQEEPPSAVYLDAPYTREEYSRYYHVLETILHYKYPSSVGKGRCPDRANDEYFVSPFFTKSAERIKRELVNIIQAVLQQGWVCAWSYSDRGVVNILDVVDSLSNVVPMEVISYSTPYRFKAQGGKKAKQVKEYCIVFIPKGWNGKKRP